MAKTLLLADDSVTIQKVVGISFANEDVTLVTVDNGDDAISKAKQLRPDVILADVVMPGRSGYEVCEAIKADPSLRDTPVLLLTGTFEAYDEERAESCGAAGHISKPFEAQTLVEEVKRLIAAHPVSRASEPTATPAAAATPAEFAPAAATAVPPRPAAATLAAAPAPSRPAAEAPATPAAAESFDFFDDDAADLAPAAPLAGSGRDLDLDDSDSAFAFGTSDPGPGQGATASDAPSDRTVAILPDDTIEPAGPPLDEADLGLDMSLQAPQQTPQLEPLGDDIPLGELRVDLGADLDLLSDPADGPQVRVDSDDLAQATVLDPLGASGFDVSFSDLGDAVPVEPPTPAITPAAEPVLAEPRAAEPVLAEPRAAEPALAEPRTAEPVLAEPPAAPGPVAVEAPVTMERPPELDELSLETLEPVGEPEAEPTVVDAESAALAESALANVAPRLRKEIHETLEKVAWESLSDVTDQIVRHAVERIEAIAWEVIPQMAETLIREEIRKLKDDG
jgi:CheY-like chemotaxis protein